MKLDVSAENFSELDCELYSYNGLICIFWIKGHGHILCSDRR